MLISLIKEPKIFPIVYLHFLFIFQGSLLSRWKKKYWYSILNIHIKIILAKSAFQLYHISIIMRKILWPRSNASIIAVFLFHLYLRQCLFVWYSFFSCDIIWYLLGNFLSPEKYIWHICLFGIFSWEKSVFFPAKYIWHHYRKYIPSTAAST